MTYVLDTNTLICFFKGSGKVSANLLSKPPGDIAIPSIVLFELEVGIKKSINPDKRKKQLKEFLSLVRLVPFDYEAARIGAGIRSKLENQGNPIGPYDVLIAASALAVQGTLVTRNIKEFQRISGLKLEDWF